MKFLIIILFLVINSTTLLSQTNVTSIDDSSKVSRLSWTLSAGVSTKRFEDKFIRIGYLYNINNQFAIPFEFDIYYSKSDFVTLTSASARFYQYFVKDINLFYQIGFGTTLPLPLFVNNISFGINYKRLNIEIRHLMIYNKIVDYYTLTFLSIGIKF